MLLRQKDPIIFGLKKRVFEVKDVYMPVYIQSAAAMKSLYMDFAFESSNRYIKAFFEQIYGVNQRLIQNKINTSIEPVVPEFPLKEEGKRIIKEKVKKDMNDLLKELGIKGEVEEVYIKNILAG